MYSHACLKVFLPFSSKVPVQLGTTLLDWVMMKITVEELAHVSSTSQQTYMSTLLQLVWPALLSREIITFSLSMPYWWLWNLSWSPLQLHKGEGIGAITVHSCWVQVVTEPLANHWVMRGIRATNTYGDLCPGSKCIGMVMRNSSAWKAHIPPKTVIGYCTNGWESPWLGDALPQQWVPSSKGVGGTMKGQPA